MASGFNSLLTTGATRTLSGSGSFSLFSQTPYSNGSHYTGGMSAFRLDAYFAGASGPISTGTTPLITILIQAAIGGDGNPYTTGAVGFCNAVSSTWAFGGTLGPAPAGGTWAYSFDVEEVVYLSLPGRLSGSGEVCAPSVYNYVSLRPKTGGSYSVSFTVGSSTLSVSGTITSAMTANVIGNQLSTGGSGFRSFLQMWWDCGSSDLSAATSSFSGALDGTALGYTSFYNSATPQNNQFFIFNSGIASNLTSTIGAINFGGFNETIITGSNASGTSCGVPPGGFDPPRATFEQWFPTNYSLAGQVVTAPQGTEPFPMIGKGMTGSGSTIGPFTLNPSGGAVFQSGFGALIQVDTQYGFSQQVANVPSNAGFCAALDSTDANTNSETNAGTDTRLLIRMPITTGPTLAQSTRIVIDPCNSISTPGTWTGVTVVGGHLSIDTSSATVAQGTYSPAPTTRQGRYLAISIDSPVSASPVTVALTMVKGVVTYSTVTGASGSPQDVVIDLCACPGYPGPDTQFSRYDYPSAAEGPTWGANAISKIKITFPGSTGIYSIQQIAITQVEAPILSTMCADIGYQSGSGSPYYELGVIGDVDGRRNFEQPAAHSASAFTGAYAYLAVSDMLAALDPGITGSYTAGTNWYDPSPAYLAYLGGGGATYLGTTPSYWIRNAWNQAATIPLQMMVDGVMGYPNMGDLFGGGARTGNCKIFVFKILRGTFNGVVFNATPAPIPSDAVTSKEGATVTGSGTSDSEGVFRLGGPGSLYSGDSISAGAAVVSDTAGIRQDKRIGIAGSSSTASWQLQDNQGRLHLAVLHDGDVVYNRADFSNNLLGWATSNTVTSYGDVISARMDVDTTNRIWLTVGRKTGSTLSVYYLYSDNDGSDFSTGVQIASAQINVGVTCLNSSAVLLTWFVYDVGTSGTGKQHGMYSEGTGQAFGSPFVFQDHTNTDIGLADGGWSNVEEDKDNANQLCWAPILTGGSAPTVYVSSSTGKTWAVP